MHRVFVSKPLFEWHPHLSRRMFTIHFSYWRHKSHKWFNRLEPEWSFSGSSGVDLLCVLNRPVNKGKHDVLTLPPTAVLSHKGNRRCGVMFAHCVISHLYVPKCYLNSTQCRKWPNESWGRQILLKCWAGLIPVSRHKYNDEVLFKVSLNRGGLTAVLPPCHQTQPDMMLIHHSEVRGPR